MARERSWIGGVVLVLTSAAVVAAQSTKPAAGSDNYDELYWRYLAAARTIAAPAVGATSIGWMTGLALDPRARNVNDLVTIRVVESIVAMGTADSSLNKKSDASASLSNFFGLEDNLANWLDPTNLVNHAADTQFKGGGATSRSSELSAVITARVVEVLPSGDLVLEGAREIDINGDRQIIVLTGVVRPTDIDRSNVVRSSEVGQLRIRYFGRGLIKDNLKPGWLVRVLNKIF